MPRATEPTAAPTCSPVSRRGRVRARDAAGVIAGLAGFGLAWRAAKQPSIDEAEEAVMRAVNAAPHALYPPVNAVMQLGSLGGGLAASALLARRHRAAGVAAAVGVLASWGGAKLVKRQTGRGRPDAHLPEMVIRGRPQTGLGFPSGHAAVATTVAVAAWPVVPPAVRVVVAAGAATTVVARVYVGAHLPLDVAGGAAMGLVAGCAGRMVAAQC